MLHHSKLSLKNIWNHSVISLCLKVKNNDEMLEDCPNNVEFTINCVFLYWYKQGPK